jgi:hypothetical protein
MLTTINFVFAINFFYQNNVIFTSCTIKNPFDLGNPGYSTGTVAQDMMGSTFKSGFKSMIKISVKYNMKIQ